LYAYCIVDKKRKQINYLKIGGKKMELQDNPQHKEGPVARAIEEQTAKLPSDVFLWAALGSIGVSLALKFTGHKHTALFVGQWAPTFLLLGLYNKIVKTEGHDQLS
jgi:hypothetical protein